MASPGTLRLLSTRRFLPLFVTQFLGAANDNLYKNAIAILIIYRIGAQSAISPAILVTLSAALFILPYLLLSGLAGELADRYEKSRLIRIVKFAEIPIAALAIAGLILGNAYFLLLVLFLFGVQSTFFGPLKYAVLPEHLGESELIGGNALIEGGTFLAVLIGTIVGGLIILTGRGIESASALMLALALAGFGASQFLPDARGGNPEVRVRLDIVANTRDVLKAVTQRRDVFLSVLGISWFWAMGATFLAEFPAFAKDVLAADEHAVTLMLAAFSIGIGAGSLICARLLKGEVSARYVPLGALGMALFSFDLYAASGQAAASSAGLAALSSFLARPHDLRVLADLTMIAICGGIFIVPLYTILQSRTEESGRARAVAANNIMNAAVMVTAAVLAAGMLAAGMSVPGIFLVLAVANTLVALYICRLLPDTVIKSLLASILRAAYRVEVKGLEHLREAGKGAVIVVNHVSFLDAVLLAAFLPDRPVFAINTITAERWWMRPFLPLVDAIPIDPANPLSARSLIRAVRSGQSCVIFPEGRITVTGALMKIYEGPAMIADRAEAPIVPLRIDGAQYTPFSRLRGRVRLRWFPPITLTILAPRRFEVAAALTGRARRRGIGSALYDVMAEMVFETCDRRRTLFRALLDARAIHGGSAIVLEGVERKPMSFNRLIVSCLTLGRCLARRTARGETVGLMLPNAVPAAVALFALHAFGRIPAMLNFTAGPSGVASACATARVRTVITSRRFIEQARLEAVAEALAGKATLLHLEDVRDEISLLDKIQGALFHRFAHRGRRRARTAPESPATVLFTSGSEGAPKGVVLSHENILANCFQLAARVDFTPADRVFNALPVFHSFGLTGGLMLPILSGVRTFLYPSPLHYRIIPELVYDTNTTIFFGTDTFLAGYARAAHPYDFFSVRYVFAGAEKVKEETRRAWADKFGLRILEGYGATETAPVIAANTPMQYKSGTVGRILPGIEHRLDPVAGIAEGGRLAVRGPNVMLGYLLAERPGALVPPADGWYDTGDIVSIDAEGFLRILGRAKRFAKIGGEMVSLARVESEIAALWPEHHHAVIAVPDPRKGEQLVLATNAPDANPSRLHAAFRERGLTELLVPKSVLRLEQLPLLGTGKPDYPAISRLAAERVEA